MSKSEQINALQLRCDRQAVEIDTLFGSRERMYAQIWEMKQQVNALLERLELVSNAWK